MLDLSLRFEDNSTSHDDIILGFAGQTWVCDSYYLALDNGLLPDREDVEKVKAVLRRLLDQWLAAVEDMSDGATVFLPYDFSDENTAWLQCKRTGGEVSVSRVWSYVEGWSINPSAVGEYLVQLGDVHPDEPTVRATIIEVLNAIRTSLANVG